MPLDPRIPMGVQPINIEPRSNALMRAAQLQGMQQNNVLRDFQLQQAKAAVAQSMRDQQEQAQRQAQIDAYLASRSGQQAPKFDPMEAARLFGIDGAKKLQDLMQPKADKLMTVSPGAAVFDPATGKPVFTAPSAETKPPSAVQEYEYAKQQGYKGTYEQWVTSKARAGAASTHVSYGTPVAAVDASGKPIFLQPTKDGSPPNIIPGVRPPLSAAEERAAADRAAKEKQSQQVASIIKQARELLESGTPTASGLGTMVDAGARVIGQTTPGAQAAAQLQALGGWFVSNVPRMEGPQSNFDVQNYMTMAGKIGDSTVPIKERLAALKTVEQLQRKYADINGTPLPAAPAQRTVKRTGTANGRKVVEYSDGSIEYAD